MGDIEISLLIIAWLKVTIIMIIVSVCACATAPMNNKSRMYLKSLIEDFMLFVPLPQGIYLIIAIFDYWKPEKRWRYDCC